MSVNQSIDLSSSFIGFLCVGLNLIFLGIKTAFTGLLRLPTKLLVRRSFAFNYNSSTTQNLLTKHLRCTIPIVKFLDPSHPLITSQSPTMMTLLSQVLFLFSLFCGDMAFAFMTPSASQQRASSRLHLAVGPVATPPAMEPMVPLEQTALSQQLQQPTTTNCNTNLLHQGAHSWLTESTLNVALQERKIPTAEEIAAKKRNFNIIFWGGGFVAPFLATIFYFGPKFWTK